MFLDTGHTAVLSPRSAKKKEKKFFFIQNTGKIEWNKTYRAARRPNLRIAYTMHVHHVPAGGPAGLGVYVSAQSYLSASFYLCSQPPAPMGDEVHVPGPGILKPGLQAKKLLLRRNLLVCVSE